MVINLNGNFSNNSYKASSSKKFVKEVKKETPNLEAAQELKILEKIRANRIKAQNIRPFVLELKTSINNPDALRVLMVRWGQEIGFLNLRQEEYLNNNPTAIAKTIINAYFAFEEGTHCKFNSSFKPMDLKKLRLKSKKEIEMHNRVEDEIVTLNPNYNPSYIEI
jgi:hypothetical protein